MIGKVKGTNTFPTITEADGYLEKLIGTVSTDTVESSQIVNRRVDDSPPSTPAPSTRQGNISEATCEPITGKND